MPDRDEFWQLVVDVINEEFVAGEQLLTLSLMMELLIAAKEVLTDGSPAD